MSATFRHAWNLALGGSAHQRGCQRFLQFLLRVLVKGNVFMSSIDVGLRAPPLTIPGRSATARKRARMLWGGGGFLLGMLVWHVIGFWTFITTIVLKNPAASTTFELVEQVERLVHDPKRSSKLSATADEPVSASTAQHERRRQCSAIVLDRQSSITSVASCEPDVLPLRLVASGGRGDRLTIDRGAVAGWAASVDKLAQGDN